MVPSTREPVADLAEHSAGAILTVDLAALRSNYLTLQSQVQPALCGAVVKADGYGLGASAVAPVLHAAGCRHFFVAHLDEAIALREVIPRDAMVYVMHGVFPGGEAACHALDIIPVSNSPKQLARWAEQARRTGQRLPAVIQIDTGMSRFGFMASDLGHVRDHLDWLTLTLTMSHLACADTPGNPANAQQLSRFAAARTMLPPSPATLAASSGIFLGSDYHFDLVRPGAALYGVAPTQDVPNPLQPVIRLDAKIVQRRDVPAGTPIGYGHTVQTTCPARLVTVAVGYADGYLRSGSGHGCAWIGDCPLPIMGRVSMDSIVLDASAVTDHPLEEGDTVELIGPHRTVDDVATDAGTIGYEILTSLGHRYRRHYRTAKATR